MPIYKDFSVLVSHIDRNIREQVVMTYISEEEENVLDEGKQLTIERGDASFIIHKNNVYCYGEVDFSIDSLDCQQIATFNFLNFLLGVGVKIPSDYDYENHECHSPIRHYRWTETWSPEVLARYAYACLNKPKRVALFKRLL